MGRLSALLLVVLVGSAGCSSKKLGDSGPGIGGGAIGGSGGAGAGGATTVGAGGSGAGGASTVGAGGSSAGGATTGTGGGATAGSAGGAAAGANGGGGAGGTGTGTGGAAAGTGGATGGAGGGDGPRRLVIFYTRWGTAYPEWFPTGTDRSFSMSAMLQPLDAHKADLIVLSGLTNATVRATSSPALSAASATNGQSPDEAMTSLLTARPGIAGGPAQGPSLDTVVGNCDAAAGPPLRLAVGQFGFEAGAGVSFGLDGTPIRGATDPHTVAMSVLGHDITAPNPGDDINTSYPALGAAQMAIATEALATSKTCAVTLMWGDQVTPTWLGLDMTVHNLSVSTNSTYVGVATSNPLSNPSGGFQKLQNWYAQQFAALLDAMQAVPLAHGSLLDRSVVVWISDTGAGSDDWGYYIPVIVAGGGGGHLDRGRVLEINPHSPPVGQFIDSQAITRTQGDLLAALARLWGITSFGDPLITRQPLTEILLP